MPVVGKCLILTWGQYRTGTAFYSALGRDWYTRSPDEASHRCSYTCNIDQGAGEQLAPSSDIDQSCFLSDSRADTASRDQCAAVGLPQHRQYFTLYLYVSSLCPARTVSASLLLQFAEGHPHYMAGKGQ